MKSTACKFCGKPRLMPHALCADHVRERDRERYQANREKKLERNRAWRKANRPAINAHTREKRRGVDRREEKKRYLDADPTRRERERQRCRSWRAANPDLAREAVRRWAEANPEANRLAALRYARSPRGRIKRRLVDHARRQWEASGPGVDAADIERLLVEQRGLCAYCQTPMIPNYEIEHRVPRTRGGMHAIENIVLACKSCNSRKRSLTDVEFMALPARRSTVLAEAKRGAIPKRTAR